MSLQYLEIKMKLTTLTRAFIHATGLFLALIGVAHSQSDWPNRPVKLIATFAAGGSSDLVARQLAQHLSARYGQQFIVENKVGASGNIGVDFVAKSAPDGYTLVLATTGPLANNKSMFKTMPFDPEKDLTPIGLVGEIPMVIAVNPALKANNLIEFVALGKSSPIPLTLSNPGNGTIGHLVAEYLRTTAGTKIQSVPYRGDSLAMADALSGTVNGVSTPVTALAAVLQANKLRAIAVMSKTRYAGLPNVPTAIEQGFNVEATAWSAVVGPAKLPKNIVDSLNLEINKFVNSQEGQAKLGALGMVGVSGTPAKLGELMASEAVKWKRVVESAKISIE
jgi:tripartite-type tricarboxylate transporter receptor subunit TctC